MLRRNLLALAAAVGVGKVYGPYEGQGAPYTFSVTGKKAYTVLEQIHPYLSEPKQEQAARVLAEIEEHHAAL